MTDIPLIDLHTHNQNPDVTGVVSYSVGSGQAIPLADFVSAGVHPWDAEQVEIDDAVKFLETASIVAVGEIGLDFATQVDKARQTKIFSAQLSVAERRNLPVIIHCVKAYNEVVQILRNFKLHAIIFHGYSGSRQQTANIIKLGYYISIGERSLRSPKTISSIRLTPLDRIFAETDTSKIYIDEIYERLALIKQVETTTLKQVIYDNFKNIFE